MNEVRSECKATEADRAMGRAMHERAALIVARESKLSELLNKNSLSDEQREVVELIHKETLQEMKSLGVELDAEREDWGIDP